MRTYTYKDKPRTFIDNYIPFKYFKNYDGTALGQCVLDYLPYYTKYQHKKFFNEPFTGVNTDRVKLGVFLARLVPHEMFYKKSICKFCGQEYERDILNPQEYCHQKKCKGMNKYYGIQPIIPQNPKDVNNYFQKLRQSGIASHTAYSQIKSQITNKSLLKSILEPRGTPHRYWNCPETGWIVPVHRYSHGVITWLKMMKMDVIEYYTRHFPQFIRFCKLCGHVSWMCIDLYHKRGVGKFCNRTCQGHQQYSDWLMGKNTSGIFKLNKKK